MSSHEIREYKDSDAHDIAVSFNLQNEVWPGGFSHGKEITADDVRRWQEESNAIAVYVSVENNHARGYCSLLYSITEEQDTCYIGLLGAPPEFHGKGHGRDLLRISITKAIEVGMRRVDLHTWAGNLKAVPLYKKTGFMWIPETTVFMMNFIPMIVSCPLAAEFFNGMDWYELHERELDLVEDEEKFNGVKVYSYRFKREQKTLHVKIDAKSREMIYFEDDSYLIYLNPPDRKHLQGGELMMTLNMTSKNEMNKEISISGFGERDIHCDYRSSMTLENETLVEIPYRVGYKTQKGGMYDTHPTVGINLSIGEKNLKLAYGMEAEPAVGISVFPKYTLVGKNSAENIKIELTNNVETAISGELVLPEIDNGTIQCNEKTFDLNAEGKKSLDIKINLEKSLVIPVHINYESKDESNDESKDEKGTTAQTEIPILVSDPFEISSVSFTEQEFYSSEIRTTRDGLVLCSNARGAKSCLNDPANENGLLQINPTAFGPPFDPTTMDYHRYEQIINSDGSITMKGRVDRNPNLIHHQTVSILGGGWLCVKNSIINTGDKDTKMGMSLAVKLMTDVGAVKFPLDGCIISGMRVFESYPAPREIPIYRKEFDEGWISIENESGVWGIVMGDDIHKVGQGWRGTSLTYQFDSIPAGGHVDPNPVFAYAGTGDYNVIRNGWWRFIENRFDRMPSLEIHKLRRVFTIPAIPVVSDETECEIHFDNLRLAEAAGEIILTSDDKTVLSEKIISFEKIKRNKHFSKKLKITVKEKSAGASILDMNVNTPAGTVQDNSLILRVDPLADVHINQVSEEFVINNALAEIKVDASWGGGIHSFSALGKDWLQSPYPDKKAMMSWYNPWRGGIRPTLKTEHDWLDQAYKEDWKLKECSQKVGGLNFKGVELSSVMVTRDELKGSEIKSGFLLSEGHRILRFVLEVKNLTDITYRAKGGFEMFLDVHPEFKTRQMFEYGYEFERKEGYFAAYHKSTGWIITENEDTHECLLILLVNPSTKFPFKDTLWVGDQGNKYGQHAESEFYLNIKAGETAKYEQYMIPCENVDEAKKLIGLTNLGK